MTGEGLGRLDEPGLHDWLVAHSPYTELLVQSKV